MRETQKIKEAMGQTFVGDIGFSGKELAEIYEFAGNIIRSKKHLAIEDDEIIFVAMVNAIKDWKSDEETFWECIYKTLIGDGSRPYNTLTGVIDRLGAQGKILYLSEGQKRYYATLLAHAFAPRSSTEAFFELCWRVFANDMNFTYVRGDEIFKLVGEELKRNFSGEESLDNDFELGGNVYALRAGIKRLAIEKPDEMRDSIESTVKLLCQEFEGGIVQAETYFSEIFCDWWKRKRKNFGIRDCKKKEMRHRAITDYTTIRPRYSYDSNVQLTIPSIRLKKDFETKPIMELYQSTELVKKQEMPMYGSGLSAATEEITLNPEEFAIDGEDIEISIKIVQGDEKIFDSGTSLYREFILFAEGREILQDECKPGNYILFAPKQEEIVSNSHPKEIKRRRRNIFALSPRAGEMLQFRNRVVLFLEERKDRSLNFISDDINGTRFVRAGEEYMVIDGDLRVVAATELDITKYGVRYESVEFKLKDFAYQEINGKKIYSVSQLLKAGEPQKISIFSYADNKIVATYNVVKFENIRISYSKPLYYDNDCMGEVHFQTERFDKRKEFDANQGEIVLPFENGELLLSPPILKWRIDWENFTSRYGGEVWYKTYTNAAELAIELPPEITSYSVSLRNDFGDNVVLQTGAAPNSYKLGEKIWAMLQCDLDELTVYVEVENTTIKMPIVTICYKQKFKQMPFEITTNELLWDASKAFVGESEPEFKVVIANKKINEQISIAGIKEQRILLPKKLEEGIYQVEIDIKKSCGFREEFCPIYKRDRIIIGDINKLRFKGKRILIKKVRLTNERTCEEIAPIYVDELSYVGEQDNCLYYMGRVFIVNKRGKKVYLDLMKNSDGVEEKTNPIRLELKSERSCFIVAGVNPQDMTDFLGEFTLDSNNRISNINKGTRGIDYFLFDTEEEESNV